LLFSRDFTKLLSRNAPPAAQNVLVRSCQFPACRRMEHIGCLYGYFASYIMQCQIRYDG
jgi:hypothetical protein